MASHRRDQECRKDALEFNERVCVNAKDHFCDLFAEKSYETNHVKSYCVLLSELIVGLKEQSRCIVPETR